MTSWILADKLFFGKLGVFSGGWTIEAAHEVVRIREDDPLDALARLIDVSLVLRMPDVGRGARFTMLETIREYALEILARRRPIREIKARHTRHYFTMAEQAKDLITGPRPGQLAKPTRRGARQHSSCSRAGDRVR